MPDMSEFTIFPAIDLRAGRVVRLRQGDPTRQTVYSDDPAETAERWLGCGAQWLHVVNLDGAFGEGDAANRQALSKILGASLKFSAKIQFGGGLRSLETIHQVLEMGVSRAILGTITVEQPEILAKALEKYGPERVLAGVDARDGIVRVRGWALAATVTPIDLAKRMQQLGLTWLIYTDVQRDGVGIGVDLDGSLNLAQATGLKVIASGGVKSAKDILLCREAGLAGVIVGRALYEGQINLKEVLNEC
jgi:phosphoribosylformimino-5-aminoimidazole carboxamide ribotide isomerase